METLIKLALVWYLLPAFIFGGVLIALIGLCGTALIVEGIQTLKRKFIK